MGIVSRLDYSKGLDFDRGANSAFKKVIRIDHKQLIRDLSFNKSIITIKDIQHAKRVKIVI
jgi:hypothetical protein